MESEEAASAASSLFIFSEGRTYTPPTMSAVIPSCVGSCAPPESIAFSGGDRQCRKPSLPEQRRIFVQFSLHETLHRRVSGCAVETARRFKES